MSPLMFVVALLLRFGLNIAFQISNELKPNNETESEDGNQCDKELMKLRAFHNSSDYTEIVETWGDADTSLNLDLQVWPGNYDSCMKAPYNGQFCWAQGKINSPTKKNMTMYLGVCLPESCNTKNLQKNETYITSFVGEIEYKIQTKRNISVFDINCEQDAELTLPTLITIISSAVYVLVITVVSICDYCYDNKNSPSDLITTTQESESEIFKSSTEKLSTVVKCFSLKRNITTLTTISEKRQHFRFFHGMRFFAMTLVVFTHHLIIPANVPMTRTIMKFMKTDSYSPADTIFRRHLLFTVDIFFFISGFLMCYGYFKKIEDVKSATKWGLFYIHRYLRLTPTMFAVYVTYIYVMPFSSRGPFWFFFGPNWQKMCEKTAWSYLLYVNNFIPYPTCMGWLWYLACDMQFFVISPIFLISLQRAPYFGLALTSFLILVSSVATGLLAYENNLVPGYILIEDFDLEEKNNYDERLTNFIVNIYVKPYCRIAPYLVGILVGYFIYLKRKDHKMSKITLSVGWLTTIVLYGITLTGLAFPDLGMIWNAVFNGVHHTLFATVLGWISVICVTGYGGFLNAFLSMKVWVIPSKLTFSTYLVQSAVINWFYFSFRNPLPISASTFVVSFFGCCLLSYLIAFVLCVTVELPAAALENLLLMAPKIANIQQSSKEPPPPKIN